MEKDRKIKTIAVAAVLVAIVGLSIAFAALSQTLTINGSAKAEKSTWQVVWEKIAAEDFAVSGTAEVQTGFPKLDNDTSKMAGVDLSLGTITLKKPGDKVTYKINMANNGDIDAKVTGVTGVNLNNTYVDYSVKYLDNNTDITQANGRLLRAGAKKLVLIEVKFKESVTTEQFKAIPQEGITVDLNGVQIQYSQNDGTGEDDPEPQGYSFTLNQLTELSSYNFDDAMIMSTSEFWNLIGEDLSQNDSYTNTTESDPIFAIESDSNVILGLNDPAIIEDFPPSAIIVVMAQQLDDEMYIGFVDSIGNGYEFGQNGNMTFEEFLNEYGDVTFTFVDASNMNF